MVELEQNTVAADAVGNGILKSLKTPRVLPSLAVLSLFFQKSNIHLGMHHNYTALVNTMSDIAIMKLL